MNDDFRKWATANAGKIRADALDEAALGFRAGRESLEAEVRDLKELAGRQKEMILALHYEAHGEDIPWSVCKACTRIGQGGKIESRSK